jgi:hypothetical protein
MVPGLMIGSTLPVWMIAQFIRQKASTTVKEAHAVSPSRALEAANMLAQNKQTTIRDLPTDLPAYLIG